MALFSLFGYLIITFIKENFNSHGIKASAMVVSIPFDFLTVFYTRTSYEDAIKC